MPWAQLIRHAMLPPILWKLGQRVIGRQVDRFEYAEPDTATRVPAESNAKFWTTFLPHERIACEELIARVRAGEPLLSPRHGEQEKYQVFADVLALAARDQPRISVLDYGGSLGDYYWIGKAMMPGVELDYHCRELPAVADIGRTLTPAISWHIDDQCLEQSYDLVMFSSSVQYTTVDTLRRAAAASRHYLLLSDVPAVRDVPAFFSTQHSAGVSTIQRHPNRAETFALAGASGLTLLREFDMGPHPAVSGAPEQPSCTGWLFHRG
jgi:putative methyltransferase (TIGR04325 family)